MSLTLHCSFFISSEPQNDSLKKKGGRDFNDWNYLLTHSGLTDYLISYLNSATHFIIRCRCPFSRYYFIIIPFWKYGFYFTSNL